MKKAIITLLCLLSHFLHAQIPCDGDVIKLDNSTMSNDTIAASDSLYSSSLLNNGTVRFQSNIMICFEAGFEVEAGVQFEAMIEACDESNSLLNVFAGTIDLLNLPNYSTQAVPNYINEDNTPVDNPITDIGATLGRVLFYDKNLSRDNTISCASCHQQQHAFSDLDTFSLGVSGRTGRHAMRLINSRFATDLTFFWDERAPTLEAQTTEPIQNHVEMGFSGTNGDQDISALINKLGTLEYYEELFTATYGNATITEERMQHAMAQFIRSIQSFDSKYDIGRAQVNGNNATFPNFTTQENTGKDLYMTNETFADGTRNRIGGGLGCNSCHGAPEFDIDDDSDNNGVISTFADPSTIDVSITRAPSLRDMFNSAGELNGALMHTGDFTTIELVIDHYNNIDPTGNTNLDNRLGRRNTGNSLNITAQEKLDLIAFLKTLSGSDVYTNPKWSDPFELDEI